MKDKFKSYSFWMSVTGAVILVLNNIGKVCGFTVNDIVFTEIVDSICGVLILFGVITISKDDKTNADDNSLDEDIEKSSNQIDLKKDSSKDEISKKLSTNKSNKNKDE